jgi:hypothetical protein
MELGKLCTLKEFWLVTLYLICSAGFGLRGTNPGGVTKGGSRLFSPETGGTAAKLASITGALPGAVSTTDVILAFVVIGIELESLLLLVLLENRCPPALLAAAVAVRPPGNPPAPPTASRPTSDPLDRRPPAGCTSSASPAGGDLSGPPPLRTPFPFPPLRSFLDD